jgi:hypothetical protein
MAPLGWLNIARLGLVQSSLVVMPLKGVMTVFQ